MGKAVTLLVRNANDQDTMARTESPRVCSWSYLNSFLSVVDIIYGLGRKRPTGAVSVAQDDIRPVKKVSFPSMCSLEGNG